MNDRAQASPIPAVFPRSFTAIVIVGFGALLVYAATQTTFAKFLGVFGVGVLVGGASFLGGGLLGFLFGVPRSLQVETSSPDADEPGIAVSGGVEATFSDSKGNGLPSKRSLTGLYAGNTNLEQISDWLTKILVGVGLTQLGNIGDAATAWADFIGPAVGGGSAGEVVALATTGYYIVAGFLLGYVWTRTYLPGVFRWAERERFQEALEKAGMAEEAASRAVQAASEALDTGTALQDEVSKLRQAARRSLNSAATKYETLRDAVDAGPDRTRMLADVFNEMRASAGRASLEQQEIRDFVEHGTEGERLAALAAIQADPDPNLVDVVARLIDDSRSAFEQYEALSAASTMVDSLDPEGRGLLREAIQAQSRPGGFLVAGENEDAIPLAHAVTQIIDQSEP